MHAVQILKMLARDTRVENKRLGNCGINRGSASTKKRILGALGGLHEHQGKQKGGGRRRKPIPPQSLSKPDKGGRKIEHLLKVQSPR